MTVNCQKVDSVKVLSTDVQKIAFIMSDSIYRFTLFIESNGKFYFRNGFIDTSDCEKENIILFRKNDKLERYRTRYTTISSNVDTIKSYSPIKETNYIENSLISISDEVKYSYIFKQFSESETRVNTIRILYPCEDLNDCNLYLDVKISFFKDSVKIYNLLGQSLDISGIKLIRNDSCVLKKKDVEILIKQLDKIKSIPNMSCRRPGNPWLLECTEGTEYKRFIISNYCLRDQKNLKPIADLCYLILGINYKYFKSNCTN